MNQRIRKSLIETNPWWKNQTNKNPKKRKLEKEIKKYIDKNQIISITGMRRSGKTYLLHRIINQLLNNQDPSKIMYFSFDNHSNAEIMEIIEEYEKLQEQNINQEETFIFLDEVQKLENWTDKIKRVYDNHENVKIFVSGSESLFFKKSKESLAGRIFDFRLKNLSFKEYLQFKELDIDPDRPDLYEKEIKKAFKGYMDTSGFPELAITPNLDENYIQRYLEESVMERIIFRDIPNIFPIRNPADLESIMNILIDEPSQLISIQSLSNDLDLSRQTVSKYLKYLEMTYLIRKAYNYSESGRKRERKLKKYHLNIPSLALIRNDDRITRSKAFESLMASRLEAEYFWRNSRKDEVDIVLQENDDLLPIEVKYKNKKEYSGLLKFMNKFNVNKGIVITRNLKDTEKIDDKKIKYIPGWKYLLRKD